MKYQMVKHIETGKIFPDMSCAAKYFDIPYARVAHIYPGDPKKVNPLPGYHFEKISCSIFELEDAEYEEKFKPIPGYEGLYSISNKMRIRSDKFKGRMKRITISSSGQHIVVLSKNDVATHYTVESLYKLAWLDIPINKQRMHVRKKPIKCLNDGKVFNSQKECCANYHLAYATFMKAKKASGCDVFRIHGYTFLTGIDKEYFEIKGSHGSARVFTSCVDIATVDQIQKLCDQKFIEDSEVCIMPDTHAGKGCTIGTTMTIKDKAVPNLVGVDIGCALLVSKVGQIDLDLAKVDEICNFIPSGRNIWDNRQAKFDLEKLKCYRQLKDAKKIQRGIATLGGGNHFVEVDQDDEGNKYFVLHTGSRNLGKQVAEYYQKLAIQLHQGLEERFKLEKAIIEEYKLQGRRSEIQDALKQVRQSFKTHKTGIPDDLCYLYGEYLNDYLFDMKICQEFAQVNRETYMKILLEKLGIEPIEIFTTWHNYIDLDNMILRKGAISAQKDEIAIIPMNMRDGSLIVKGKGNPDWNYSAPHGAGRLMSRTEAREKVDMNEFKESMKDIYSTSVCQETIDEAPQVYKPMEEIVKNIAPTCEILKVIKPIYNFKARDTRWTKKK